jgi:hypothetical protein
MKIYTIHIIIFVFAIHALTIFFLAFIIRNFYVRRNDALKKGIALHKLVSWLFTLFLSICGFHLAGVTLEALKFNADVGGHNVVGTIFFMFFFVMLFGWWLIKFSSLKILRDSCVSENK